MTTFKLNFSYRKHPPILASEKNSKRKAENCFQQSTSQKDQI